MALAEDIQLYSVLCDQSDGLGRARRETHQFFITINLAACSALGYLLVTPMTGAIALITGLSVLMIVLSLVWMSTLDYYRRINAAKMATLLQLEKGLQVQPLAAEWEHHTKQGFSLSAGKLERIMPLVFVVGYLGFVIFAWREQLGGVLSSLGVKL
ncbi:MAG TPA: hypothetical protein VG841_02880 [Caulobacterales bacterium]|nr:hypothetical protein [Caulobacterales bacterium]